MAKHIVPKLKKDLEDKLEIDILPKKITKRKEQIEGFIKTNYKHFPDKVVQALSAVFYTHPIQDGFTLSVNTLRNGACHFYHFILNRKTGKVEYEKIDEKEYEKEALK